MTPPNPLRRAQFLASHPRPPFPPQEGPEIAFAARSNSGKSTLINALCEQKGLVRTSRTPGRTQAINFFSVPGLQGRLVDLPGYGFAKVGIKMKEAWGRVMADYLIERPPLTGLVLVVDARRGLLPMDYQLIDLLDLRNIPCQWLVALTKIDKLSRNQWMGASRRLDAEIRSRGGAGAFPVSAPEREGLAPLLGALLPWFDPNQ